ncbi:MAG: DUF547 domain-containing protein, partial [Thiohalomonadales bacterium]
MKNSWHRLLFVDSDSSSVFRFTYTVMAFAVMIFLPLTANAAFDQNHSAWNTLLQKYVVDHGDYSQVNYKAMKVDEAQLDGYLAEISALTKSEFGSWNRDQQLATLINAYNAFTVKLILKHYPVKSIKDIGSFFTNSWKITFFELFGEKTYLDHIEHDLIRGNAKFSEPRIHFTLVCASVGCPKLSNGAFTASNLESKLEASTRAFLQDKSRNRYVAEKRLLQLSKIFDWYGGDFVKKYGSVQNFVAKYVTPKPAEQLLIAQGKVQFEYLDYDWSL